MDSAAYWREALPPAKGLAQNPQRYRNGNEEQAQAYRATPAEPRPPRAPMFQMVIVAPASFLLDVLETFALVCHKVSSVN